MSKKILFLGQLPENISPSQRFRIEAYKDVLTENGFQYYFQPFFSEKYLPFVYKKGAILQKVLGVLSGFLHRLIGVYRYRDVDYVFVQREATPIGPPVIEWIYSRALGKKLIYDFDDAIWLPNVSKSNRLAGYVKCFWKVKYICSWAHKVSAGNDFLATYASKYSKSVVYNPTCVDLEGRYTFAADQNQQKVVIGWTGSHTTLLCFEPLFPMLKKLEQMHEYTLLVICDEKPATDIRSMEFIPWKKETEIENLSKIQIGLMPLNNDLWSEGKCGFKIIQYFALKIPAVASAIGVNKKIIVNGENGYICHNEDEWLSRLSELIKNQQKRIEMGEQGRKKVETEFSLKANSPVFLSLFSN